MAKRYSNQRITKIKRDVVAELLKKAEQIPVEQGTTKLPAGSDLISYPEYNNVRQWTRDNLLKGLSGIKFLYYTEETSGGTVDNFKLKTGEAQFLILLDGLILKSQMYKHIAYDTTGADEFKDVQIPKPGLQLSNLMTLYSYQSDLENDAYSEYIDKRYFRDSFYKTAGTFSDHNFKTVKGDVVIGYGIQTQCFEYQAVSGLQSVNYQWGWQPGTSFYTEFPVVYPTYKNSNKEEVPYPPADDNSLAAWRWIRSTAFYNFFLVPTSIKYQTTIKSTATSQTYTYYGNDCVFYSALYTIPGHSKAYGTPAYNSSKFKYCHRDISLNRAGIPHTFKYFCSLAKMGYN